ncbi:ribonuclease H-like domain-containing protein [Tanacetum coccineum]
MVGSSGSSEDKISSLDLRNPLHLQNSDFNSATIISVKLTGTENYKVWAAAMKLAISTRNKTGFLDGTCLKSAYDSSASLSNQWDRCNSIVLSWLLNSVSKDLFLGQIFSDNAFNVWAELKGTYDNGSIILSLLQKIHNFKQDDVSKHYQLMRLMQLLLGLNDVYQPIRSSLLSRETLPDVKKAFAIISREVSHRGIASSSGFIMKLMSLINDMPSGSAQANMAVVDISDLNLTVGHPNGTLAKIKYVGNLQLSKDDVLYDVLVVPEYCDLIQNKIVGTGSESGGLYMFDQSSSHNIGNSVNISAYVSKTLWHTRLGHPADQVLNVLHKDLQMSKGSHVSLCDTCHRAKQTREPFSLSEHKTSTVGDLIHLDL